MFEQKFAKMPEERVELTAPAAPRSATSAAFCGLNGNTSSSLDKSESAEGRATRLAEVQDQVSSCTDLYMAKYYVT